MAEKKLIRTPKGTALWTSLNKPDVRYKAEGMYEVKLAFDGDDEAVQELRTRLEKSRDEKFAEIADGLKADGKEGLIKKLVKLPVFDVEEDGTSGEETGRLIKKFKMTASGVNKKTGKPWSRKPKLFNAKGVELKAAPNVGSGSTLKISFEPYAYYSPKDKEIGVSARMEAVQIIDLVAYGERDAAGYGFGAEDGYDDEPEAVEKAPFDTEDGADEDDDL